MLAATNQNLERLIAAGRFRDDLYYRLQAVTIRVPPLRERRDDIPELAHHFLFRYTREADRDVRGFDPQALELLRQYDWPGNVRQLQNCVRAAVYQAAGQAILPADLRPLIPGAPTGAPSAPAPTADLTGVIEAMLRDGQGGVYGRVVGAVERELIARALRHTRGHLARASELLGINRTTLRHKLREFGIAFEKIPTDRPDPPDE